MQASVTNSEPSQRSESPRKLCQRYHTGFRGYSVSDEGSQLSGKLPADALSSGVALNIKYTPETNFETMRDHFAATVKAFFDGSSREW